MIQIPTTSKTIQVSNSSDWFGNISYTKNINLDEQGYIKLSSRAISFKSEKDDSNFNIPISFGRANGEFHIVTADQAFDLDTLVSNFAITEDTNTDNPTLSFDSWGKWFQNRWHASTNTKIWYTTGGTWTDTSVALTSGKVHAMEVFRSSNSLCVSNGNTVKLLDTSYATTVTLTIPTDFEIVALSYSNQKMGVVTMMSDSAASQNQEAYFFIWDGVGTSAGQSFPMGTDTIMAITAYKSSWVILTRTGELKYFNGGGFETIGVFPFFYQSITWGDSQNRETYGDIMVTEGDRIYINLSTDLNSFGRKGEEYLQNNIAGIWCYDPNVGLYHRYSASLSPAYFISVSSANVNTTTDIITASSGTLPATGNPIMQVHNIGSQIGGVSIGQVYHIIRHTSTTFSLAETKEDAENGVKVNITSANDAKFVAINTLDYSASKSYGSGGIGIVEEGKLVGDHLLFGADIQDYNSTTSYDTLCITLPKFENRGYVVTPKIPTQNVEDTIEKIYVKYRPLDTNDKIILKYKDEDALGIPTSTPQWSTTTTCTWTDANTLTTTADLSEVKSYLDADSTRQCEVEIIAGAGGGQMSQVSSITESGGTYTVNLVDDIDGAASTYRCDIIIDNWKLLKTKNDESSLGNTNTLGWAEFPVNSTSKWIKFKVELRGYETCIEELLIVNRKQTPAT